MHPKSHRRLVARTSTPRASLVMALAATLSFIPLREANAQHGGHQAHHAHEEPAPRKHLGQPATSQSTQEFHVANQRMMRNMAVPYTGDADVDFRVQMIPHHQGAIDMARVAMRHAKDPWTRQLAEAVIVEQQREIAEMQAWLARRGAMVPAGGQPTHIMGANSFRSVPEEAGTRAESRGQSWAPGSGIPARQ
jgi:hypothetical protein